MTERKFIYEIVGLQPASGDKLGRFGFSVFLDREIARKALEKELPYDSPMIEISKQIVRDCGLKIADYENVYYFVKNKNEKLSCLMHYIQVPGNSCQLGMDWMQVRGLEEKSYNNWVKYNPSNIDNHHQAYALLGLFTYWANIMNVVLRDSTQEHP